jgi:hypothetical protein
VAGCCGVELFAVAVAATRIDDEHRPAARHQFLATLIDMATYGQPTRTSLGVRHLLVSGEAVIRDGQLVPDAFPGRALCAQPC